MSAKAIENLFSHNYLVHQLTKDEINDPYLVIKDLFQFGHLPEIREMLWESFKATITGNYPKRLDRKERNDIVYLYEYIERLVEASHLINENQKLKNSPYEKSSSETDEPVLYPLLPENIKITNIKAICEKSNLNTTDHFQTIVETIVQTTNAEKVFFVNIDTTKEDIVQYDFLALLPGNSQFSFKDFQNFVDSKCNAFDSVILWCSHLGEVYKLLKEGHIFYSIICAADRLVYDNGRIPLPEAKELNNIAIIEKARSFYNEIFATAKSFLHGARYYVTVEQQKTAAFMLHQATEHALRALLFSLTTYNTYTHNLAVLLRHCNYCAPELTKIFPQDTDKEKELFRLLNIGYVNTRYKNKYEISDDYLMLLLDRVDHLQIEVQQFFEERLLTFQKIFEPCISNS